MHRSIARRAALAVVGLLALAPAAQAATSTSRATLTNSTPDWATPNAQVGSVPDSAQHTFWVYLSMRNSKALDAAIAAATQPGERQLRQVPDARPVPRPLRADRRRRGRGPRLPQAVRLRRQRRPARQQPLGQGQRHDGPGRAGVQDAAAHLPAPRQDAAGAQRRPEHRALDLEPHRGHRRPGRQRPAHAARHRRRASGARPSSTRRRARPRGARRSPSTTRATRRSRPPTASSSCRTRRAATRPTSCRAPTAPRRRRGRPRRPRPDGGDRRRLRVADHRAGRQPVRDDPRPAGGGLQPDHARGPLQRSRSAAPTQCDAQGWYGEETLDVEAVHAMAPGAHVLFVGGADCLDESLIDAVNKIVDGSLAQIVSNSYGNLGETGEDAGLRQAWNDTFRQAALEGIGMYFSSGDSGDEADNLGHAEADFPASHPLVTAVGGTSLGVSSSDGYLFETGWGTTSSTLTNGAWDPAPPGDHIYGSGGGTSLFYAEPDYQKPRRAEEAGQGQRRQARARGARRQPRGRPEHGHARRPDADVPRRDDEVQRVPPRRHEPVLAAHGGRHGPGRPAGGPSPRLRQPGAVRPVRHAGLPRHRRARPAHRGRAQRLRQLGRRHRRHQDDAADVRPDREPAHHARATTTSPASAARTGRGSSPRWPRRPRASDEWPTRGRARRARPRPRRRGVRCSAALRGVSRPRRR